MLICQLSFPGGVAEYYGMVRMKKNKALLPVYVRGLYSGKYTLRQASESTGYSIPWLCQLKKAYSVEGGAVFENKNRGRIPVNKKSQELREKIAAIYSAEYSDVNFCYFRECLKEFEGIDISLATLRNILAEYGLRSPEARKVKKKQKFHRPRVRRECEGDLLQIDGTPYPWFYKSGDVKKYCMVGGIDDATGKITALYLTENECLYGYLELMRQTCLNFGIPREIYSDRAAIFCVTPRGREMADWERLEVMKEKRTQWQRILEELNVRQILAWSPEAKGRVERMWRTLQGQLPIWFFKHGISNMEQANAALPEFIQQFNKKFSIPPAIDDEFWLDPPENLDEILVAQFKRRADRNACIMFQQTQFHCPTYDGFAYRDVLVCISERGIFAKYQGQYYPLVPEGEILQDVISDSMPHVVSNIIYRYLYAYAKEISA